MMVVVLVVVMVVINNVYNLIFLFNSKGTSGCHFTCCIVDEATQSQGLETLIPLMLGVNTLVLVGDAQQQPATVLSKVRTSLEPFFYLYFVCVCVCARARARARMCTHVHTCVQVTLVLCLLSYLFALTPLANVDHLVYAYSLV
jgi:hypothetical protein